MFRLGRSFAKVGAALLFALGAVFVTYGSMTGREMAFLAISLFVLGSVILIFVADRK